MKGILADVNVIRQVDVLIRLLHEESRREFWAFLNLETLSFQDLGLQTDDSDLVIWQKCQDQQLVLLTGNRNQAGTDSLEATIRFFNQSSSLPVLTLANPDRILQDKRYAHQTADKILEYLFEMDNYRGTGRLYVP